MDNALINFEVGELVDIGEGHPATILKIEKNVAQVRSHNGSVKWRNLSEIGAIVEEETGEIDAVTADGLFLPLIRADGGTQMREELNQETVADYADAMHEGANFPGVTVFYDGTDYWLGDGFHRKAAAEKLGRDRIIADIRMGTRRDALLFACGEANNSQQHQTAPLKLTRADKRRRVEALLRDEEWCSWSDNKIAAWCGVTQPTVSALRKQIGAVQSQRTYTRNNKTMTMDVANIGNTNHEKPESTEAELQQKQEELGLGKWNGNQVLPDAKERSIPNDVDDRPGTYVEPLAAQSAAISKTEEITGKDSDEQYTPKYIWELGLEMLGKEQYDLDPFSNSKTNPNVPASVVYAKEDDGLLQPWEGDGVWINPPYSITGDCVDKIVEEYVDQLIDNVYVLVQSDNSTKWYQQLLELYPVCLLSHRVKFKNPNNTSCARFASSLFYLGDRINQFVKTFDRRCNPKGIGLVVFPLDLGDSDTLGGEDA